MTSGSRIKRIVKKILLMIASLVIAVAGAIWVWLNFSSANLKNRALMIVVESNGYLVPEDVEFYREHKRIADFFIVNFLGVKRTDLDNDDILKTLNFSVDAAMANSIKRFGKGYGKIDALTGKDASWNNLVKVLENNTTSGYISDIVTVVHGGDNYFWLESQVVWANNMSENLKGNNIGFVYQTNCFGDSVSKAWLDSGAKAVFGTEGTNSMVVIAPQLFIRAMVWKRPFEKAVMGAYNKEILFWKTAKIFIPGIYWTDEKTLNDSYPMIRGERWYKI